MAVQHRLDAAADRIEARRNNAFTGIVVSAEQRKLNVYWKGGQPPAAATRAIDEARHDGSVQVLAARYSETELLAEAGRVTRMDGVTAVSPNIDGSGLSVSFAPGRQATIKSNVPITQTGGRTCSWRMFYVDVVNSLSAYSASSSPADDPARGV